MTKKLVSTTVYLRQGQLDQLKALSAKTRVPVAVYIRDAIDEKLRPVVTLNPKVEGSTVARRDLLPTFGIPEGAHCRVVSDGPRNGVYVFKAGLWGRKGERGDVDGT